ncbi:hypothetical protein, partial [Bacillus pumilus]
GLTGLFEFSTVVFKRSTIRAMAGRVNRFLTDVSEHTHLRIDNGKILAGTERQAFLPTKKRFPQLDQAPSRPALFQKT